MKESKCRSFYPSAAKRLAYHCAFVTQGKPSYTLDLDDLFKRKPRTAPLPNDAVQSDGTLGGGASQAPTDLQPSRNGLGARSQAAAGAGAQPVKNGSGVGLGGKNAAMDAVTAALKQRQAASNAPPEERNSDSVSADWVKTPSGDSLTKPVSVDPESDRVASDETGGWSPSLTNPPLRTELSFGPVEGHADGAEATGREQERSEGGGMFDVRTDDDVAHLRYEDGQEGVASDGFSAGSGQLRELLEAETGLVGSSERGAEEGAGVRTKGAESDEQDPGALQSGSTRKRGDRKIVEKTVQQSGSYGWEKESGGLFGDRNSQAAESRRGETSTSGGQNLGFGKGGTRSRLFGDSDEDDDYGLPLFGGKLGQRQGGRRRGLFEDSDEEPGGSGFGRRSTGLFDNGSALENDDVGAQKRSTGLFGDSGTATGGLFASDRGKGDVSSGSVSEATSLAAKAPLRSVTAKAVGKADEGLLGEPKKQTALSTDLFGDDEEDGDLFGLSGLGRRPRDKPVAEEVGSKRTSGVSALLESTYSSDEEDPWEGRLAKLKEGQH